jgi:hypothetical protein
MWLLLWSALSAAEPTILIIDRSNPDWEYILASAKAQCQTVKNENRYQAAIMFRMLEAQARATELKAKVEEEYVSLAAMTVASAHSYGLTPEARFAYDTVKAADLSVKSQIVELRKDVVRLAPAATRESSKKRLHGRWLNQARAGCVGHLLGVTQSNLETDELIAHHDQLIAEAMRALELRYPPPVRAF